ncbi:MAG: hypothetical protein K6F33_15325 [Bacteroidales bacterium]|nr:hypothetical protein [Bacteroidales bacterium]
MATLDDIQKSLADNKDKVYKKDYKFYSVDYISTLAKACIREGCDCRECCAYTEKLALYAATYPDLINAGEAGRRQLEDGLDDVTKHLVSQHGYARTGWFVAMYSLVGFGIGLALALLAYWVVGSHTENPKALFLVVMFMPVMVAYIIGSVKDAKYKRNHKNL